MALWRRRRRAAAAHALRAAKIERLCSVRQNGKARDVMAWRESARRRHSMALSMAAAAENQSLKNENNRKKYQKGGRLQSPEIEPPTRNIQRKENRIRIPAAAMTAADWRRLSKKAKYIFANGEMLFSPQSSAAKAGWLTGVMAAAENKRRAKMKWRR